MEIAPAIDFGFNSSPNYYSSAPSSPNRLAQLYCEFDELLIATATHSGCLAAVPFAWEEKPGVPKTPKFEDDFTFDLSSDFGTGSVPAEDLFHGGVIKTVFEQHPIERERGRERGFSSSRLPSRRTRSLSPLGGSDYRREHIPATAVTKPASTPVCENGSKRWSFKDLFLFRSASEGRAMEKYPLKKYFSWKNNDEDCRKSSESGSTSKRRTRLSAHELHYNRANLNDLKKKKTYLPYKHGILGGLSFNP